MVRSIIAAVQTASSCGTFLQMKAVSEEKLETDKNIQRFGPLKSSLAGAS